MAFSRETARSICRSPTISRKRARKRPAKPPAIAPILTYARISISAPQRGSGREAPRSPSVTRNPDEMPGVVEELVQHSSAAGEGGAVGHGQREQGHERQR